MIVLLNIIIAATAARESSAYAARDGCFFFALLTSGDQYSNLKQCVI